MNKKSTLVVLIIIFISAFANAQTITTFAGGGIGDNNPAVNALTNPLHVKYHKGALYLADVDMGLIRKIDANGIITTVAGHGSSGSRPILENVPATVAQLMYPTDIAFDSHDNMYISDAGVLGILKVDVNGILTQIAGDDTIGYAGDNGPAVLARLNKPAAIAVDKDDNIFIADGVVRKIDVNGIITTVAGAGSIAVSDTISAPATSAGFSWPSSLSFDNSGNLYITDQGRILKVNTSGHLSVLKSTDTSINIASGCLTIDSSGNIYTVNPQGLYKGNSLGVFSRIANGGWDFPTGIAFTASGQIYVADHNSSNDIERGRLWAVSATGVVTHAAGIPVCDGDIAADARLFGPVCLSYDGNGNMYILHEDYDAPGGRRIRTVNRQGIISTAFMGNLVVRDIAANKTGDIFVATGRQIRKIAADGAITIYAGSDSVGYTGDGGPAAAARLSASVIVVTVDDNGDVYFRDGTRVRKVDSTGIISTIAGNGAFSGITQDDCPATATNISAAGLTVDKYGDLLILEYNAIRKVTADGFIHTIAGSDTAGRPVGTTVNFKTNGRSKITVDTSDNIYFTTFNSNVIKIDRSGVASKVAGRDTLGDYGDNGPADTACLNYPGGVAVDDSGRLYVADYGNSRVRRIDTRYKFPPPVINVADTTGSLSIYPNPSAGVLNIASYSNTPGDVHILIYDMIGRKVAMQTSATTGSINESFTLPSGLPIGAYVLKLMTPSGNKTAQFLLVK